MSDANFFTAALSDTDAPIAEALAGEANRQARQIELIASENIVSRAVLDALGHQITNKTLEGYPGKRFHGGAEFVDVVERAAIERARRVFDCAYANVQPHSGTQANQAVFLALLKPGDKLLSLNLAAGGHLSHGAPANVSGRWFEAHHYGVDRVTGLIDYDQVETLARQIKPRLLITGGSAYPREIDFPRLRRIADQCEARLLVDMAHFAGLVAAGVHPSPLPHADVVTCTTTKTLRGPRGGLILSRDTAYEKALQAAVFPGVQGSLHTQILAAKAVCLGEASRPAFRAYGERVRSNARELANTLQARGLSLVSGGTDTHLVLLDLSARGITGQDAQAVLGRANITSNSNPIPFDSRKPSEWVGLRLGVAAATTRGFGNAEMRRIGELIADLIEAAARVDVYETVERCAAQVAELCDAFPLYPER